MNRDSKIILALDFDEPHNAISMIEKTREHVGIYKLGLEFYLANGISGVNRIQEVFPEISIFLDLKLHDIPNTVRKSALAISSLQPRFLTVHASGGKEMIAAASEVLPNTAITAVTVLTSLESNELRDLGLASDALSLAVKLAQNATRAGAKAVVCSPLEVAAIRAVVPSEIELITPGVRPKLSNSNDQKRTATARDAVNAGADYVVIGRPITQADDPRKAAAETFSSLQ